MSQHNDKTPKGSIEDGPNDSQQLASLQARKKEIMEHMNSLVNNFNKNNQKIKDANKDGPLSLDKIKEIQEMNEALRD